MLFKRRKPVGKWDKVRGFFWPRTTIVRSARYIAKRVLRLTTTPHAIAAGFAAGAAVSFLPFIGFHFVLGIALAFVLRGNILASAFGTAVGNPLTFPFIWGVTYSLGRYMLYGTGGASIEPIDLMGVLRKLEFGQLWGPLIKPMVIGGIPIGIVFGLVSYGMIRWALTDFQRRRKARLERRAMQISG